ncbi:MAG: hypothetical protein AB7K24_05980 [Gemmataceae bacterium]
MNADHAIQPEPGRREADAPAPTFACPHCARPILLKPELAGKEVRCPACTEIFTLPAEPVEAIPVAEAGPADLDFRPGQAPAAPALFVHDWQDWRTPRAGLLCVLIGNAVSSLIPILIVLGLPFHDKGTLYLVIAVLSSGVLTTLAGLWLCALVAAGARIRLLAFLAAVSSLWAVLCVTFALAAVHWHLIGLDVPVTIQPVHLQVLLLSSAGLAFAGGTSFLFYLKGLAVFFNDRRLQTAGLRYLIVWVMYFAALASLELFDVGGRFRPFYRLLDRIGAVFMMIWLLAFIRGILLRIDQATRQSRLAQEGPPGIEVHGVGPGWSRVRSGLTLVWLGAMPIALAITYAVLVKFLPALVPARAPMSSFEWIAVVLWSAAGCGLVLLVVGLLLCCQVPPGIGLRGQFVAATLIVPLVPACLYATGALHFAWSIYPVKMQWPDNDWLLMATLAALFAGGLANYLFLWAMHGAALFFNSKYLAQGLVGYLIGSFAVPFAAGFVSQFADLAEMLSFLVPLGLYVWLFTVLRNVQKMIDVGRRRAAKQTENSPS